ncbi:hypothetical protein G9396_16285 [Providencia rettgeri]|nr:hypothetical protein G9396_16285 [Providencia rettgeri]
MRLRINLRLQTIMSMVAAGAFVFTLSACSSSGGNKTDQADTVAANYAQQIVNLKFQGYKKLVFRLAVYLHLL